VTRERCRAWVGTGPAAITIVSALVGLKSIGGPAAAVSSEPEPTSKYSVRWIPSLSDTNQIVIQVEGLEAGTLKKLASLNWGRTDWEHLLAVCVKPANLAADIGLPAMLGTYSARPAGIRFEPAYPLNPGLAYRAIFHPDQLPGRQSVKARPVESDFQVPPRHAGSDTVVRQVYPSADVLPENLLKFYIQFSAPMSGGHIYEHIHLSRQDGTFVELPFLEIGEELWDPAMTRLTLFIDPGRIKRGVRPLEEVGPALEQGKRYTLVLDGNWHDALGVPLKETFCKTFTVGPPDRRPIDPARWKIVTPHPGSVEPLKITFPKPMDYALAQRVIHVTKGAGVLVKGTVTLENQERDWLFHPARAWEGGRHMLLVQTTIEDLAGNNIGKPFEVDLFEPVQRQFTNTVVNLPFEVR
jgi:hypothetical protein